MGAYFDVPRGTVLNPSILRLGKRSPGQDKNRPNYSHLSNPENISRQDLFSTRRLEEKIYTITYRYRFDFFFTRLFSTYQDNLAFDLRRVSVSVEISVE